MSVRRLVLAFVFAGCLAFAADKHPKPLKVQKHAVHTPKTESRGKEGSRAVVHKPPKISKHKVSTPKIAKHKPTKFKKQKA